MKKTVYVCDICRNEFDKQLPGVVFVIGKAGGESFTPMNVEYYHVCMDCRIDIRKAIWHVIKQLERAANIVKRKVA